MIVMGFDPGYGRLGQAVVALERNKPICLDYGTLETSAKESLSVRLYEIRENCKAYIETYNPDRIVIEKLFFNKNTSTAEGVYQARGVLLAEAGGRKIEVVELSPNIIKKAVTGNGRAEKNDVIFMVGRLLGIKEKISPDDSADALACALAGLTYRTFTDSEGI